MQINTFAVFRGYNPVPAEGALLTAGTIVYLYAPGADQSGQPIPGLFAGHPWNNNQVADTLQTVELRALTPDEAVWLEQAQAAAAANTPFAIPQPTPEIAPPAPVVAPVAAVAPTPLPVATAPAPQAPVSPEPTPVPVAAPPVARSDAPVTEYIAPPDSSTVVAAPAKKRGRKPNAPAAAPAVASEGAAPTRTRRTKAQIEADNAAAAKAKADAKAAKEAAKTAAAAAHAPANAPAKLVPVYTGIVQAAIGTDALASARRLIAEGNQNNYLLGGVLSYVSANKLHLTIKNADGSSRYADSMDGFDEYLKCELGVTSSYKVVRNKINAFELVSSLGLAPEVEAQLVAMGHTNILLAAKALQAENADILKIISDLSGKTSAEVKEYTKSLVAGDPTTAGSTDKHTFHFVLFGAEGSHAREVLNGAKALAASETQGEVTDSQAFSRIVAEYSTQSGHATMTLDQKLEVLRAQHPEVAITVALDPTYVAPAQPAPLQPALA